jgi:hypothetical protein
MEEDKKTDDKMTPGNNLPVDHYTKTSQKVGDFFLGFLGALILPIVLFFQQSFITTSLSQAYFIIYIVVGIALCIYFHRIGRRYITIGIVSICFVPIIIVGLVFGSCLLGL